MPNSLQSPDIPLYAQQRYRDNFARHLLGLTRHLQSQTMHILLAEFGHEGLRLNFEPYIALLGDTGSRLSDIADTLGVSRQSANQTANVIEAAGYAMRVPDPCDGRARRLILTTAGQQLRRDGIAVASGLQAEISKLVATSEFVGSVDTLAGLNLALKLPMPAASAETPLRGVELAGLLPRLAGYIEYRLMTLTAEKGHPGLRLSFGQVLTLIGPQGGSIQRIANIQEVSKQAISAIARELQELDYIRRELDPEDARQLLLKLTPRGETLIADSVASVDTLGKEFSRLLGAQRFKTLCRTLETCYRALGLEDDIFTRPDSLNVSVLARQLRSQLGAAGAKQLAQLLVRPDTING
jgi:DNA-binding MarR family transcriptional regulator